MFGIIDRFEGDFAVVEFDGRTMKDIPRATVDPLAKEGDVIVLIDGQYKVDTKKTAKRKAEIEKLTENLWE